MKQMILVILFMASVCTHAEAQTFNELFRQKKTQRKYLAQQIAALKVYLEYLKVGYRITKKGLALVGDITGNNLADHTKYFGSLSIVNESLEGMSLKETIRLYQGSTEQDFNELLNMPEIEDALTTSGISYVNAVRRGLLVSFENSSVWLTKLTTDDELQIRDDERIDEISKVVQDLKGTYVFSRAFVNSTRLLVRQRQKEKAELKVGADFLRGTQNSGE